MQDNTQVRSLRAAGADALLLPTYTPVRVDEENVSGQRVFMGGINVYLDSRLPGWRYLPSALKRWLDKPGVVRLLSRLSSSTSAAQLGPLTVDLLNGDLGPQKSEIAELVRYLAEDLRPEVILFSNALLSGVVPSLRKHWKGTLICMLQGDDVFLEDLPEPWKSRSLELIRRNCSDFDLFLTHSDYYTDFMNCVRHAFSNCNWNDCLSCCFNSTHWALSWLWNRNFDRTYPICVDRCNSFYGLRCLCSN